MNIVSRLINKGRRVIYGAWGSKLGHGCRVTKTEWNKQYSDGEWDKLTTLPEKAHYDVIVSFCLLPGGRNKILDLGCGDGTLLSYFTQCSDISFDYRGVDLSTEAISIAKRRYPGKTFEVNDIENYLPNDFYDRVVFNESLYYVKRPMKLLKRLESSLTDDGTFVISMCEYKGHDVIWRLLNENYKRVNSKSVDNSFGQTWEISEFKKIKNS